MSSAQQLCTGTTPCVTTWHNDNYRTGWQQNETVLTTDPAQPGYVSQSTFGLLYNWTVTGRVYAQPLAVYNLQGVSNCQNPCNVLFVATEDDKLYAINTAGGSTLTYIWGSPQLQPLDLAAYLGGTYVDCGSVPPSVFEACTSPDDPVTGAPNPMNGKHIGVTGTPVIDTSPAHPVLYVVAAVCFNCTTPFNEATAGYYLFAVDATNGTVLATTLINGSVQGQAPAANGICTSTYPATGAITFSPSTAPNAHLQRSGLLLLNGTVYVAFADLPERYNGWIFGYTLSGATLQMAANLATTPYGTGGGIWGAGAGPASDGTSIFLATANGTIFDSSVISPGVPVDVGDSLLRLVPSSQLPGLTVKDWWTPYDVLNYSGKNPNTGKACTSLCECDEDLASGGVLVVPPPYTYTCQGSSCTQCCTQSQCAPAAPCSVVINADKQSNVYVANQANLGGFQSGTGNGCPSNPNNIECIQTPVRTDPTQGYWSSPAYWHYNDGQNSHYWLYYSATMQSTASGVSPEAVNAYQLPTTGSAAGPISQTPYATTSPTLFCDLSPTPSVSSNPSSPGSSGIVWAVESIQNKDNQGAGQQDCDPGSNKSKVIYHGALHAFCATAGSPACPSALYELFSSRGLQTPIAETQGFAPPTVFNGQVYMGTNQEIDVFGICTNGINGKCLQ